MWSSSTKSGPASSEWWGNCTKLRSSRTAKIFSVCITSQRVPRASFVELFDGEYSAEEKVPPEANAGVLSDADAEHDGFDGSGQYFYQHQRRGWRGLRYRWRRLYYDSRKQIHNVLLASIKLCSQNFFYPYELISSDAWPQWSTGSGRPANGTIKIHSVYSQPVASLYMHACQKANHHLGWPPQSCRIKSSLVKFITYVSCSKRLGGATWFSRFPISRWWYLVSDVLIWVSHKPDIGCRLHHKFF